MTDALITFPTNEWPTQIDDLEAAANIINRHVELNEGEPLGLIEVVIDKTKKQAVQVRLPDWVQDIVQHFQEQYGSEHGQSVASKVITRVLLKDETIH